jgi:hypothetical protein
MSKWRILTIGILFVSLALLQFVSAASIVPYDDLLRDPDVYEGQEISISGEIIQALDNSDEVRELGWGTDGQEVVMLDNNQNVYSVYFFDKPLGKRVIKGDMVTLTCLSAGLETYNQASGGAATVPVVLVKSGRITS